MEKYDIIIIGAGPAGLSAAQVLGAAGKKVLLLEKNPKIGEKICAGGLTSKDFEVGIPLSLAEKKCNLIKLHYLGKIIEIRDQKPLVVTVSREELGQWMASQIKGKVDIRTNSKVVGINKNSVLLENNKEVSFDYLIGADGSLSLVRKYLGLTTQKIWLARQYLINKEFNDLEIFFDKNWLDSGYLWIFPHKNYTSIGCGTAIFSPKAKNLQRNFSLWLKEKNINVAKSPLKAFPINFDYQGCIFENKFLIGDAAGLASGLTGEGIYFAIISGQEIAKKILNSNYQLTHLKQILKIKKSQETVGRFLLFQVLKSQTLTQFLLKKFI